MEKRLATFNNLRKVSDSDPMGVQRLEEEKLKFKKLFTKFKKLKKLFLSENIFNLNVIFSCTKNNIKKPFFTKYFTRKGTRPK
jgi:hypothetical protein